MSSSVSPSLDVEITTCETCIEAHNKQSRAPVRCPHCAYLSCVTCVKRELLSSLHDPRCMRCHAVWSFDFLHSTMTKAFLHGDFREHRARVLADRNRVLLPGTQRAAVISARIWRSNDKTARLKVEKEALRQREEAINDELAQEISIRAKATRLVASLAVNPPPATQDLMFHLDCPVPRCLGFLSKEWKCGLCGVSACNKCLYANTSADHVCHADHLAKANQVKADARSCPKCHAWVHRLYNCETMRCTVPDCGQLMCWSTGEPLKSEYAAPEILTQRPDNVGKKATKRQLRFDGTPFPDLPTSYDINSILSPHKVQPELLQDFCRIHQCLRHVTNMILPTLMSGTATSTTLQKIRIQYLLQLKSYSSLAFELERAERSTMRLHAERVVLEQFVVDCTRYLVSAIDQGRGVAGNLDFLVKEMLAQVEIVRARTNAQLLGVSELYDCTVRQVASSFRLETRRFKKGDASSIAVRDNPIPQPIQRDAHEEAEALAAAVEAGHRA